MRPKTFVVTDAHRELALRYSVVVVKDEADDGYHTEVPDWPYLTGVGDTPEEALADTLEGIAGAIALREEHGHSAPEPLAAYSGQLQLRMPAGLHRALAWRASAEGVSLNATAVMLLTQALGAEGFLELPTPRKSPKRPKAAPARACAPADPRRCGRAGCPSLAAPGAPRAAPGRGPETGCTLCTSKRYRGSEPSARKGLQGGRQPL
ncbi:MAG: toxin-antitoxin system HicB family antitoxin [Candidatus Latescibacterota bacterium]